MTSSRRPGPHEDPSHPLYHFMRRLPPLGTLNDPPQDFSLPLVTTSDKLLTAFEGLSQQVKTIQKDLNGVWTSINGLHEQQKVISTRGEAEEDLRAIIIPAIEQLGEQLKECVNLVRSDVSDRLDFQTPDPLDSAKAATEITKQLARLADLPSLVQDLSSQLVDLSKRLDRASSPVQQPVSPPTTPDVNQRSSQSLNFNSSSPWPAAQRESQTTPKHRAKRQLIQSDDALDVEDDFNPLLTHNQYRKPSKLVSDLRLPLLETQKQTMPRRTPTLGLSRRPTAQHSAAGKISRKKRFLDPGSDEED